MADPTFDRDSRTPPDARTTPGKTPAEAETLASVTAPRSSDPISQLHDDYAQLLRKNDLRGALAAAEELYLITREGSGLLDRASVLALTEVCRTGARGAGRLSISSIAERDAAEVQQSYELLPAEARLPFAAALVEYRCRAVDQFAEAYALIKTTRDDLRMWSADAEPTIREEAAASLLKSTVLLWEALPDERRSIEYLQRSFQELLGRTRPAESYYLHGMARAVIGDHSGAEHDLEKARERVVRDAIRDAAPQSLRAQILEGLGLLALQAGSPDAGVRYLEEALIYDLRPRPSAPLETTIAQVFEQRGAEHLAAQLLRRALFADPSAGTALAPCLTELLKTA